MKHRVWAWLPMILCGIGLSMFAMPDRAFGERYYSIQIGACRELKSANDMVDQLKKLGHNAFYRHENIPGKGMWYRVYVEKFKTRAEAEKEAGASKDLGLIGDFAVRAIEEGATGAGSSDGKNGGKKVYFLHVSSYEQKALAEETVSKLKGQGLQAFAVPEKISGKAWFRIYIGEYRDVKEARRMGKELKEKGVITYYKPIRIDKAALSLNGP